MGADCSTVHDCACERDDCYRGSSEADKMSGYGNRYSQQSPYAERGRVAGWNWESYAYTTTDEKEEYLETPGFPMESQAMPLPQTPLAATKQPAAPVSPTLLAGPKPPTAPEAVALLKGVRNGGDPKIFDNMETMPAAQNSLAASSASKCQQPQSLQHSAAPTAQHLQHSAAPKSPAIPKAIEELPASISEGARSLEVSNFADNMQAVKSQCKKRSEESLSDSTFSTKVPSSPKGPERGRSQLQVPASMTDAPSHDYSIVSSGCLSELFESSTELHQFKRSLPHSAAPKSPAIPKTKEELSASRTWGVRSLEVSNFVAVRSQGKKRSEESLSDSTLSTQVPSSPKWPERGRSQIQAAPSMTAGYSIVSNGRHSELFESSTDVHQLRQNLQHSAAPNAQHLQHSAAPKVHHLQHSAAPKSPAIPEAIEELPASLSEGAGSLEVSNFVDNMQAVRSQAKKRSEESLSDSTSTKDPDSPKGRLSRIQAAPSMTAGYSMVSNGCQSELYESSNDLHQFKELGRSTWTGKQEHL